MIGILRADEYASWKSWKNVLSESRVGITLSMFLPIRLEENSIILNGKQKQEFLSNLIGQNIESASTNSWSLRDIFSAITVLLDLLTVKVVKKN